MTKRIPATVLRMILNTSVLKEPGMMLPIEPELQELLVKIIEENLEGDSIWRHWALQELKGVDDER